MMPESMMRQRSHVCACMHLHASIACRCIAPWPSAREGPPHREVRGTIYMGTTEAMLTLATGVLPMWSESPVRNNVSLTTTHADASTACSVAAPSLSCLLAHMQTIKAVSAVMALPYPSHRPLATTASVGSGPPCCP